MELYKVGKIWYYDHTWGTQRIRKSTGKSDKYIARMKAQEEIDQLEKRGVIIKDDDFGGFVKKYWELQAGYYRKRTIKTKTMALNHFIEYAHPKSVASVSVMDAQGFLSNYLLAPKSQGGRGMKPISANTTIRMLRQIFNAAVKWGYAPTNPFNKIDLVKFQEEEARVLTPEEISLILTKTREICPRYYDLFYFYFLTGMRLSEPFLLEWANIDFEGLMISVTWTKTKYNRRIVMLPPVVQMLKARQKAGELKPFDMYFKNATNALAKVVAHKDIKLPWVTVKVFRRCTTSYLRHLGVSDVIIEKIMGHTSAVALRNYFSLPNQDLIRAITPLQTLLPVYNPPELTSQLRHTSGSAPKSASTSK